MTEERLKDGFLEALSILHENRETLLNDIRDVKHDLENCTEVDEKITETSGEMEVIAGMIQKAIEDNAAHAQDQDEYNRRYEELADRYEKLKNKLLQNIHLYIVVFPGYNHPAVFALDAYRCAGLKAYFTQPLSLKTYLRYRVSDVFAGSVYF